jgi:hypothetical protein
MQLSLTQSHIVLKLNEEIIIYYFDELLRALFYCAKLSLCNERSKKIILNYKFKGVMDLMEDVPHYKYSYLKIRNLSFKK